MNNKKVLIARIADSSQENDLTVPANCNGFGRVRHFKQHKHQDWSPDPLPNLPAFKFLRLPPVDELRAQVFQLSSCNYRCWYCFVDSSRLSANPKYSRFFSCDELLDLYLSQDDPPFVIDLSGGQPDIVPEWGLWMMRAIERKNLFGKAYLWSDDNLSNDYFWKYLSKSDISYMTSFNGYGRVGCFKGYDEDSFSFNTRVLPHEFERQFILFNKLLLNGFDMYAYVTFTSFPVNDLEAVQKPNYLSRL